VAFTNCEICGTRCVHEDHGVVSRGFAHPERQIGEIIRFRLARLWFDHVVRPWREKITREWGPKCR
jgi:hypothetical protein